MGWGSGEGGREVWEYITVNKFHSRLEEPKNQHKDGGLHTGGEGWIHCTAGRGLCRLVPPALPRQTGFHILVLPV